MLELYNSLTRKKEVFRPIRKGQVLMYTCGPTVHDYAHLGNFRTFVFYDTLRRWLEYRGYKVKQVLNITDVDEKTLERAKRKRVSLREITQKYEDAFLEDLDTLNIETPEFTPRATENIDKMVEIAKALLEKGRAFMTDDGVVYYDITKGDYGRLSGKRPRKNLRAKTLREEMKRPKHFGLWKPEELCEPGVCWESELGKGAPGWHLECCAMAMKYLGEKIDISAGGIDLIFPHHENTLALTEAYTGKQCANFWLHSAHMTAEGGKKMSKSLRNYYTLRDVLKEGFEPRGIRLFLMSRHYRKTQDLSFKGLKEAGRKAEQLMVFLRALDEAKGDDRSAVNAFKDMRREFETALDDDLDTHLALRSLFTFIKTHDPKDFDKGTAKRIKNGLLEMDRVLGIMEGI